MRILLSAVVATGLLVSHIAAAQNCARPADMSAFDVAGLKSQLMVTAITCEATERYNAFILRHRPDLVAQERVLNAYFSRNFGRRGQSQHDDYITSLANSQSQNGLRSGTSFCSQNIAMFDDVMKLHGAVELKDYASGKTTVQPITLVACAAPRPRGRATRQASATTGTHTPSRSAGFSAG